MVSWEKNGEKINQSQHYRIFSNMTVGELEWHSNLEIMGLRRDDNGSYSCFLENKAGTHRVSLSLVVLGTMFLNGYKIF